MIYVITSGQYSDYSISAILSADKKHDIAAMHRAFRFEHPTKIGETLYDCLRRIAPEYGIENTSPYESQVFVAWLIKKHGFIEINYAELNLD